MVDIARKDPSWYEIEGFSVRLKLRPYDLMVAIASIPEIDLKRELTYQEERQFGVDQVILELQHMVEDWEHVYEGGEPIEPTPENIRGLVVMVDGIYGPLCAALDEHKKAWSAEKNESKKRSPGRRKAASTTAGPARATKRRARRGNGALTASSAPSQSTSPGQ